MKFFWDRILILILAVCLVSCDKGIEIKQSFDSANLGAYSTEECVKYSANIEVEFFKESAKLGSDQTIEKYSNCIKRLGSDKSIPKINDFLKSYYDAVMANESKDSAIAKRDLAILFQTIRPEDSANNKLVNRLIVQAEKLEKKKAIDEMKLKASKGIKVGMSPQEAIYAWGKPERINRTTTVNGSSEQWVYSSNSYLYFQNGVLVLIQDGLAGL